MKCVILVLVLTTCLGIDGDDVASEQHPPPMVGDFKQSQCWNFTHGHWPRHEFYSPRYPQNYPNNTECIQVLVAPMGYQIKLDFRDDFHVEESAECTYDFLELRDGPFGYSPLIDRPFCGTKHPPIIISSTRYLWIRFKSDDSIEYKGFKAVYDYYRPKKPDKKLESNFTLCAVRVPEKEEGFISSADIPQSVITAFSKAKIPLDCTWIFSIASGERVRIQFKSYEGKKADSCDISEIELYDRTTKEVDKLVSFYNCGGKPKSFKSGSNLFYVRVKARKPQILPQFSAMFTTFIHVHGECKEGMFDCKDKTCISSSLVCNGNNNCDLGTDESHCTKVTLPTTTKTPPKPINLHAIVLGVIGGILFTIVAISLYVTCKQKRMEERSRKIALKQKQQAAEMEMATLLNRSPDNSPLKSGHGNHHNHLDHMPNHTSEKPGNHTHNNREGKRMPHPLSRLSDYDLSEPDMIFDTNDGATFKRYLDVHNYNDEDSSPTPSIHNQISTQAMVEVSPSPHRISIDRGSRHSKTPSPRPDVVQEEAPVAAWNRTGLSYPSPRLPRDGKTRLDKTRTSPVTRYKYTGENQSVWQHHPV